MVTSAEISSRSGLIPEVKPTADHSISPARRLRKDAGAALEYLWELSGSVRHGRGDALLVEGTERETGRSLRTAYFGHYDNYAFVMGRLYSRYEVVEKHAGRSAFAASRWLRRLGAGASLLFGDVELLHGLPLARKGYLRIPQWLRQKYLIPDRWEDVLASFRKNTRKTDLRKVRKYGFSYRMSQSPEDFRPFYHHMYVPYLSKRFGEEVIIEPEWKVMRQCRKGRLLHILRDERVVAAALLHQLEGRLAYVWVGVPDDVDDDLFTGAFSAMYYFTILHGYLEGCREIDFLGSRPILSDGLFRYKRKWGTYVEDSPVPRGDILLRPLSFDEPIRAFFRRCPFVVRDGTGLAGKILADDRIVTARDLEAMHEQFDTPGLDGLVVHSLAGFDGTALRWAAPGERPVRLVDLKGEADPAAAFCRIARDQARLPTAARDR
jgi:hypothetical protein